jgi:hypothetical protein
VTILVPLGASRVIRDIQITNVSEHPLEIEARYLVET